MTHDMYGTSPRDANIGKMRTQWWELNMNYYLRTGEVNNKILMRYADVLLMYAEACQANGHFSETVWNETMGFTDKPGGIHRHGGQHILRPGLHAGWGRVSSGRGGRDHSYERV